VTAPGEMNRRLVLQAPVETADGEGGVTRSFAAVATLWAQVTPTGARPDTIANNLGARLLYRIVIRARDDVTTRHQFTEADRVYRVIAVGISAQGRALVPVRKGARQGTAGAAVAAGVAAAQQAHQSGHSTGSVMAIVVIAVLVAIAVWAFWHWRQKQQQERPA
jgi:SPP1 family predicted phage head-tail adaptor